MQKNGLDHRIRRRFLQRRAVLCNRVPFVPEGATVTDPPRGARWSRMVVLRHEEDYYDFVNRLRREQITFEPIVHRRQAWWVGLVEPDEHCSLTCVWFWRAANAAVVAVAGAQAATRGWLRRIAGSLPWPRL